MHNQPTFGISYLVVGMMPGMILVYLLMTRNAGAHHSLPNEYDLEDETLYGVIGHYEQGEPVYLEDIKNKKRLGFYQLTHVPAPVFRGKDAQNFSQMKKAVE